MIKRMKILMEFCDEMKVYFRSQNNVLAEHLFSHLEFKVGMMYEQSMFYLQSDILSNHEVIKNIEGQNLPIVNMKIYEVQNLVITHYISIIESSLRKFLLQIKIGSKMMILNEIIEHLHDLKFIDKKEKHLWHGIRQIRNAIVHYDGEAHVSDRYDFTKELSICLSKGNQLATTDIFEALKLMEWMTYSTRQIVLKFD